MSSSPEPIYLPLYKLRDAIGPEQADAAVRIRAITCRCEVCNLSMRFASQSIYYYAPIDGPLRFRCAGCTEHPFILSSPTGAT